MAGANDIQAALRHHQAGRADKAEHLFKAILRRQPDQPDALAYLGVAAFGRGDLRAAGDYLSKACAARPDDAENRYNLGVVLRRMGRLEDAAEAYRQALAVAPKHAEAANNLGNVLKDQGKLDAALVAYRQALDSSPRHALARNNMGVVLLTQSRHAEALAAFRAALDITPSLAEAHHGAGMCLAAEGKGDEAIAAFRQAIALRPGFAEAQARLGMALHKARRLAEATEALRKAVALNPKDPETHNALGQVLSDRGEREEALDCLERAARLAPQEDRYRHNYGVVVSRVVRPWHFAMLNDSVRNLAYQEAIERTVRPGMHVLEIGTGSGLLAMMAARAGAARVTTCERVGPLARKAREIIAANGYAQQIVVLERDSTSLAIGRDLPQRADLLVSEILSNSIVGEGVIASVEHARQELLAPEAPIIPRGAAIMGCLVGQNDLSGFVSVGTVAGFDISSFNAFSPHAFSLPARPYEFEFLSADQALFDFDFTIPVAAAQSREVAFKASESGTCLGLLQWNRLDLDGTTRFENSPRHHGRGASSHWSLMLMPFPTPLPVAAGEHIKITARYASEGFYVDLRGTR